MPDPDHLGMHHLVDRILLARIVDGDPQHPGVRAVEAQALVVAVEAVGHGVPFRALPEILDAKSCSGAPQYRRGLTGRTRLLTTKQAYHISECLVNTKRLLRHGSGGARRKRC